MSGLLDKIYDYNYFGYYLLIAIVLLLVLFIIILFFGKKDQHKREVEATKKLQQINNENDAFKEENNVTPLEITPNTEALTNDTITSKVEEAPSMITNENLSVNTIDEIPEPILPKSEPVLSEGEPIELTESVSNIEENNGLDLQIPKFDELVLNNEPKVNNEKEEEPLFSKTEEIPFNFSTIPEEIPTINPVISQPVTNKEAPVFSEVEVPEFNFDEVVQSVEEVRRDMEPSFSFSEVKEEPISRPLEVEKSSQFNRGPQIFSSVYVPETKPEKVMANPGDDEIDFELPVLKKKDEKIDKPILNDYNLKELAGEEYNLKK